MRGRFGKGKFEITPQLVFYGVKLLFRVAVVIGVWALYLTHRELIMV